MEVDPPSTSSSPGQSGSNLKRSNSAPMINLLLTSQTEMSSNTQSSFKPANAVAVRRLSSSNMMLQNMPAASTSPPIRGPDRVTRLKQEEIHIADREKRHERETQSNLWISNNWDNLSLDCAEPMESQHRRPRSFSESLHIMTQSNILCGSPSPTRAGSIKQCFSPSMQIPVKNTTFTPSPSPSPTRKNFMRSLSPIAMRSGALKRKQDNDGGDYLSPPKKFHTGPLTPDRLMTQPHPLAHRFLRLPHVRSISSSSLDDTTASPDQIMSSRCSSSNIGGGNNSINSSSSSSSLCIHPHSHTHPHGHPQPPGMRSPHHSLAGPQGQQSPLSSSGAPSPLSSSGHGSMGSVASLGGGGGSGSAGGNTNSNNSNNNMGGIGAGSGMGGGSFPAILPSKQSFLFRPVSDVMGSPSSTSSSSSSSSSSLSIPPHHHLSPQQQSPTHYQSPHYHNAHPHPAAIVEPSEGNTSSTSDIYMSDSEMGEVQVVNPSTSSKSVAMEEHTSYNFKPISPDHPA